MGDFLTDVCYGTGRKSNDQREHGALHAFPSKQTQDKWAVPQDLFPLKVNIACDVLASFLQILSIKLCSGDEIPRLQIKDCRVDSGSLMHAVV